MSRPWSARTPIFPQRTPGFCPNGTAYQTDAGMTGPYQSVIGVDKDIILQKFLTQMPVRMEAARHGAELHSVIVEVDESTGRATAVRRYTVSLVFVPRNTDYKTWRGPLGLQSRESSRLFGAEPSYTRRKAEMPGRLRLHGSRSYTPEPGPSTGTLGSAGLAARATSKHNDQSV